MNIFSQYRGLSKENYYLFLGKIVTNLGSMIWPVLTMILSQKLGYSATQVAIVTIVSSFFMLPASSIGGKLADRYNKKNIIVVCDFISIAFYLVCAVIPLSLLSVALMMIAATFQTVEHPAYSALIADINKTKDRERAYSLSYLGANIGLVASPIIAGVLFKNLLWLSFLISGVAIGISTVFILLFVKNIQPVQDDETSDYQKSQSEIGLFKILSQNKVLILYILIIALYGACYSQYGYLMPLDIGRLHGEDGAVIFGSVSSLNCIIVVIFTPIFTKIFSKTTLTRKTLYGVFMLLVGYAMFLLLLGFIPAYYLAITLFTFGEILSTIASGPYLTERIPTSHRGRINGLMSFVQGVLQGVFQLSVGLCYDNFGSTLAWSFVLGFLGLALLGAVALIFLDKKHYKNLYLPTTLAQPVAEAVATEAQSKDDEGIKE